MEEVDRMYSHFVQFTVIENNYIFLRVYIADAVSATDVVAYVLLTSFSFQRKANFLFWAQLNKLSFEFKETTIKQHNIV